MPQHQSILLSVHHPLIPSFFIFYIYLDDNKLTKGEER